MSKKTKTQIKENNNSLIKEYIGKELFSDVEKLFNKISTGYEYEFIFFSKRGKYLPQQKYINLLQILSHRATQNESFKLLQPTDTLEILYQPDDQIVYRCNIEGVEQINHYMKKATLWKNHMILNTFMKISSKDKKNHPINFNKKEKTKDNTIDIDNLDLRVRLSKEDELSKEDIERLSNLDNKAIPKIKFRYKQRTSLFILGDEKSNKYIRIDLTFTKMANNYATLNKAVPNYELEIECIMDKPDISILDTMINEIELLFKIIQQSNYIISNAISGEVIDYYSQLLGLSEKQTSLQTRNAISLEIQHVTEILPNKYAVTDKADGERTFGIIYQNRLYFISTNLDVKDSGIVLDKKLEKYNGSILDGELIYLPESNRHMFLAFDCLFIGNEDIRKTISLFDRLAKADQIIQDCFILDGQKGISPKLNISINQDSFDIDKFVNAHYEEMKKYMKGLNTDIEIHKEVPLVRRKYFAGCTGAKSWELFAYSSTLWTAYTKDPDVNCPYMLDGLIYQALEQAYVTNMKESAKQDYKWKPPSHNSIDFYIEFEKDKETGKILTVYDNSNDEFVENKPYRICKLYVGKSVDNVERPVLFKEDMELYLAYLFVENGEIRDDEDNIISDGTVVEFYYKNDPLISEKFRWVPMRTRFDKTESVLRFGKKYGNYVNTAEKTWRSISNPVLMEDFNDLAKGNNPAKNNYSYDRKMDELRKRIGQELISSATRENAYYQKRTKMAENMRKFHNWIKSNLIYTYCNPIYENNKQLSILDYSTGRGGDIQKFYYVKASFVVGIDIDKEGIVNKLDGAISRYTKFRKGKPNVPRMYFIQADGGAELNYEAQNRAIGGMSPDNVELFNKFFSDDPKKRTVFDRINCQFAMHYFFKDDTTFNNFKQNLKNYLRAGGYFIATVFDYAKILEVLKDTNKYSVYYTEDGKEKLLFEIIRKFDLAKPNDIYGTGFGLDLFWDWISQEGRYLTEYLVDGRYLEKELLETCDLELVDSDNFGNLFNKQKEFLTKYGIYESNEKTRKSAFLDPANFYEPTEINKGCWKYNELMKYYIFRKKDSKTQKGGNNKNNSKYDSKYDFNDINKFYVPKMEGYNNKYTFVNSLHHIMRNSGVIPRKLSPKDFSKHFDLGDVFDRKLSLNDMQNIVSKFEIEHTIKNKNKKILDGLSAFVISRNENDDYEVELIKNKNNSSKSNKAVILSREGDVYVPVYMKEMEDRIGIIDLDDDISKYLIEKI